MRSASSRPIARPSPNPDLRARRLAAVEALEDVLALLGRHARAAVGDAHRDARADVVGADLDRLAARRVAQRVVDQDPDDARAGRRIGARPARAGRVDLERDLALAGAQRELRRDGARDLAQLDRLRAQLHGGVEAREVEQLGRQHRQPPQLAARALDLLLGVGRGRRPRAGPRRAAPSCPGASSAACAARARPCHERAPRRLLAAQLLLHAHERAGEVADLVAAPVRRRGRLRALRGDPQRGALQALEAARERAREREPEPDRHREADRGGGEQRVADEPDRRRDLGQVALGDDDARRPRSRGRSASRTAARRRRSASPTSFSIDAWIASCSALSSGEVLEVGVEQERRASARGGR